VRFDRRSNGGHVPEAAGDLGVEMESALVCRRAPWFFERNPFPRF
jgi:hypothetical protein